MRIAFASEENKGIESKVAYHFGRCPYFVFVEIENKEIKNVETKINPLLNNHEPGVVPEFISKERADVIISGGAGPKAIEWFKQLGIKPVTGASGKVKDVLNSYLANKLKDTEPCNEHKE